ncbi:MAG: DUF1697 domain-containing protein [Spartobacteria bacterium]
MPRYIAFLRGINLGKRRLPMSRLVALFAELEFTEVATFIASGNVIFSSGEKNAGRLEEKIGRRLEDSLGYAVDTFVRTTEEVAALGRAEIFDEQATVHVGFLHAALPPAAARKLEAVQTEADAFRVRDREYFWLCRIRTSDSKVWTLPEMKALRLPTSSMRNMTTIRKLVAKHLT